uniref:C2H2-type domain-containing protein n=1 Tax=Hucho hucho TaxID=62062 RepID=A0A4W5L7L0_9TELE
MWQVVQRRDVHDYGMLEEFVTTVTEIVPELLSCSQRAQLILGLQARVRDWVQNGEKETFVKCDYLTVVQCLWQSSDAEVELSESKFVELVESLLKDPSERETFYQDVFPVEFGPKYDTAIQMLMLEFLSRLEKLLPIPDLEQTASLLNAVPSALEKCVQYVPDPKQLRTLLQYHRKLGHLDSIETPSSFGDYILSSLSLPPHVRVVTATEVDSQSEYLARVEGKGLMEGTMEKNGGLLAPDEDQRDTFTEKEHAMNRKPVSGETDNQAVPGIHVQTSKQSKRLHIKKILSKVQKTSKTDSSGRAIQQPSSKVHTSLRKSCKREERPYQCVNCEQRFKYMHGLKKHQRDICLKVNQEEASKLVDQHQEDATPEEAGELLATDDTRAECKEEERKVVFKCDECDKEFKGSSSLRTHKRIHNPFYCSDCGRIYPNSITFTLLGRLRDHYLHQHKFAGPYPCSQCEKTFTQLSYLVIHERVHSGEYLYQCSVCPEKFRTANSLTIHSRKHTGEKPFLCWQCGKSYRAASELSVHMGTHSEEKPFSCSQCDMTYRTKIQLNTHIEQVHEGVRFTCTVCGKQFYKAVSLKRHELTHTGERPFPCSYCEKTFITANERRLHERYHTGERPYKCQDCGKSFIQSGYLKSHQRLHTGEKPFSCSVCDKRFRFSHHMKRHQKTHIEKHVCGECGESFTQIRCLKAHQLTHTLNEN